MPPLSLGGLKKKKRSRRVANITQRLKLLDLPHEILSAITNVIEPEDLDAWLSTCRTTFDISQARLPRHKKRKAKYTECVVDGHPASLLHAIWQDSWVARYVRDLRYDDPGPDDFDVVIRDSFLDVDGVQQLRECEADLLRETPYWVNNYKWAEPDDDDAPTLWEDNAAFTLLLCLLPNVIRLSIGHPFRNYRTAIPVLTAIAKDIAKPSRIGCHNQQRYPLGSLKVVELYRGPDLSEEFDNEAELEGLLIFAWFPTVTTLIGRELDVCSFRKDSDWCPDKSLTSNVECFKLSKCECDVDCSYDVLMNMLRPLKRLNSFHLTHKNGLNEFVRPSAIETIRALANLPCASSLSSLCITPLWTRVDLVHDFEACRDLERLDFCTHDLIRKRRLTQREEKSSYLPEVETARVIARRNAANEKDDSAANREVMPRFFEALPRTVKCVSVDLRWVTDEDRDWLFGGSSVLPEHHLLSLEHMRYYGEALKESIQRCIAEMGINLTRSRRGTRP